LALRSYVDQVTAFQNLPAGTTFTWSFSPYIRKVHETPTYVVLVPDPSDARIAGWVEIAYTHPGGCLNTVRRNVWIGAPTSATGDIQGPPSLCPNGTGTYYAPNFPAIQNVTVDFNIKPINQTIAGIKLCRFESKFRNLRLGFLLCPRFKWLPAYHIQPLQVFI
jgi:hypothetical protein